MPRVLFLGTTNAGRSLMAEALLRHHGGDRFEAYSAGLEPQEIDLYTLRVLEEAGIDTEGLRSKSVDEYLGKVHFGYVITVCDWAEKHCPKAFLTMGQRMHWALDDPLKFVDSEEARLETFERVRDKMDALIDVWLAERT